MSGTKQSKINVTLRNVEDHTDQFTYQINVYDNPLANDWVVALKEVLRNKNLIEKNYCFLGFPESKRNLNFLCNELNNAVTEINHFNLTHVWQNAGLAPYIIEDWFSTESVRFSSDYPVTLRSNPEIEIGLSPKHQILNRLHNHFERLQGTVNELSPYYKLANYETKYSIRQLNILCHEVEALILSQRKAEVLPEWVRPSQINTFLMAKRYALTDNHRELFRVNGFDRRFGHVYMHWNQIGKTLFEVWRDENAPELNQTICEEINSLEYYSGEFDIEWGKDVILNANCPWHDKEQKEFNNWLTNNKLDYNNISLSLGYLPLGEIDLSVFGSLNEIEIRRKLAKYADVYKIEVDGVSNTYNYCWTDANYKQQQVDMMKPGYDYSSKGKT